MTSLTAAARASAERQVARFLPSAAQVGASLGPPRGEASPLDRLQQFIDAMGLCAHDAPAADASGGGGGVLVTTIHQVKGLEFDRVYAPFLEEGSLPLLAKGLEPHSREYVDHFEEERRLAYVALTRARKQLTLSWSETAEENEWRPAWSEHAGGGGPSARAPPAETLKRSRFLSALPAEPGEGRGRGA